MSQHRHPSMSHFPQSLPTVGENHSINNDSIMSKSTNSINDSGSASGSHTGSHTGSGVMSMSQGGAPRGLKRSPYLSVIASTTKESEDLMMALSRPTGGMTPAHHNMVSSGTASAAGGGMGFFNLKRPSGHNPQQLQQQQQQQPQVLSQTVTPVSSGGTDASGMGGEEMTIALNDVAVGGNIGRHPRILPTATTSKSGLRSSLRVGSRTDMNVHDSAPNINADSSSTNLKKNSSVTFSTTTKQASNLGEPESVMGSAMCKGNADFSFLPANNDYTAANMMKKSLSIASPEFLLAQVIQQQGANHQRNQSGQSNVGSDSNNRNTSNANAIGDNVNDSFQHSISPSPPAPSLESSSPPSPGHRRRKSKSMNTLQYYYKNQLQGGKEPGQSLLEKVGMIGPNHNRQNSSNYCVNSGSNSKALILTFREMLDEGDGKEGDLNLRLRNEQWKDFSAFSSSLNSCTIMDECGDDERNQGMLGSEGSARSGDIGSGVGDASSPNGCDAMVDPSSRSGGLKRSLTPTFSNASQGRGGAAPTSPKINAMPPPNTQHLFGSHRATVSVNDLALMRRAAARMKHTLPTAGASPENVGANHWGMTNVGMMRQLAQSQQLPGETLGGAMLTRIESTSSNSSGSKGMTGSVPNTTNATAQRIGVAGGAHHSHFASPLAQMMAAKQIQQPHPSSQQQRNSILMNRMMAGVQMNTDHNPSLQTAQSCTSLRRVRTAGAGLAYGGAGFRTDFTTRLSRFDLGKRDSRLSMSSGGSSGGGDGGKNEEWNLS